MHARTHARTISRGVMKQSVTFMVLTLSSGVAWPLKKSSSSCRGYGSKLRTYMFDVNEMRRDGLCKPKSTARVPVSIWVNQ